MYDWLNDDKRKAIEVVTEGRAERQDPSTPTTRWPTTLAGVRGPADDRMLVNCVAYRDGRKVADIPVTKIREFIEQPDGFVWVAVADPEAAELEYLQGEFDLHPLAVEDARNGHQRPKIEEYGDVAVRGPAHARDRGGPTLRVGEVAIFVGDRYVLSVRSGVRRGFSDVRARSEREPELLRHGAAYVLYALMDAVVDRYFPIVDSLEDEIEERRGAHLRRADDAGQHRVALRPEAQTHGRSSTRPAR